MHREPSSTQQLDPLLPGYSFNLYLVAGITPIIQGGPLDFFIDRPDGMDGFIINMTVKGQGKVFDGDDAFYTKPGDLLLFPPGAMHYYGRAPDHGDWYHRWVYFRPRAYWANWLKWHQQVRKVGRMTLPSRALINEFDELFRQIDETHKAGRPTSEELAINLLERLLIRCYEETPENFPKSLDARIQETCQYLSRNLAKDLSLEDIARHVCLSPSRLAHLFREHMGVNILRWREDQRVILAKHLLQSTHSPVSGIADAVGYDDQLYFSRVFRKRVGVSPSEYRRNSGEVVHALPSFYPMEGLQPDWSEAAGAALSTGSAGAALSTGSAGAALSGESA
ncbi:arabinose operon transcriptional regulator AraC [Andreprevotia chitinilytica]|uniref:arabinose operon transcriptional regulator AraC n=1 Tax=Andreprevotia chitinilytica TaxID=396808 RepID=UPI000A002B5E|nr:arabinose operon transcriptional regulator AraC [Andreprevotia chitinilytica]